MKIGIDQIQSIDMVIGESCRVTSRITSDGQRVLTVTRSDGIVCVFSGEMTFTWVIPPRENEG